VPDREASLAAGVAGERLAAAGLGRALGDEWTLLRGYRNRRGEIDLVLVGPRGLPKSPGWSSESAAIMSTTRAAAAPEL
jgi:hypothetical protein